MESKILPLEPDRWGFYVRKVGDETWTFVLEVVAGSEFQARFMMQADLGWLVRNSTTDWSVHDGVTNP